jgi:LPS export ABC transporter protein LptC
MTVIPIFDRAPIPGDWGWPPLSRPADSPGAHLSGRPELDSKQGEAKDGAGMQRRGRVVRAHPACNRRGGWKAGGIRFTFYVPVCYSIIEMNTWAAESLGRIRWHWPVAIPAVILFGFGFLPTAGAADSAGSATSSPEIVLQQVHMVEAREGTRLWEVRADQVEVNEREGFTVLTRVTRPIEISFYSRQGQVFCVANRATLDLKTKDVRMDGAVVARSDQGVELRTESLQWISASRRLQTDQPVTIIRGDLVTRGRGLEAETDLERFRILQNITSQFRPSPGLSGRSRPK